MNQAWYDYGWWLTLSAVLIGGGVVPVIILVYEIRERMGRHE